MNRNIPIYSGGGPSPEKAISILKSGQVYGKPLSNQQKEFFANLAGTDTDGNPIDEESNEPAGESEENEQEFKYGGTMKRVEVPEGPLYYMFALGGQNGIFKGDVNFENPKMVNDLNKFIKQVNIVKFGGDDIPPSADTNNIVDHKKQVFSQFLKTNTMNAIAEQEATNIMMAHDMIKQFGGYPSFPTYAYGGEGEGYDQPIGPETPYEMSLRLQKMKNQMQPIPPTQPVTQPTVIDPNLKKSDSEKGTPFSWHNNDFNKQAPQNPYQVNNTTMNGTQAPVVTPSASETMNKMTPYPELNTKQAEQYNPNQFAQAPSPSGGSSISGEAMASGIITGMEGLTHMLNMGEYKKQEAEYKKRLNADAIFTPVTGSNNRGTYDVNSGAFRPDQMVPQQFKGNTYGQIGSSSGYKLGGEHEMDDDQIKELIKQGYKIDYLD